MTRHARRQDSTSQSRNRAVPFPGKTHLNSFQNRSLPRLWKIQVKSKQQVIEWMKGCPNPMPDTEGSEIEIRQVFEASDFGAEFTPELREQEDKLREQMAKKK